MSSDVPRPEYPRPHFRRPRWLNLNGTWEFAFDDDDRGLALGWQSGCALARRILVPFSFEAPLSGIGETAAHPLCWYRRRVELTPEMLAERLLLHVGACDYAATVWVNGAPVASHRGGYAPIACEVQHVARAGENEIVVRVEDRPLWSQPRGKQIIGGEPFLIDYDRVTGIWQTVWLEPVPDLYLLDAWSRFDRVRGELIVQARSSAPTRAALEVVARRDGREVARASAWFQERSSATVALALEQPALWSPESPALYDLELRLVDGEAVLDRVDSYAGLREVTCEDGRFLLNGAPFHFRGVLDQGYFPGGWYTAASDADLRRDIELIKAMGFNGARKHQKAEDPRWLWWADRLGLAVWGEMPSGREFGDALVEDLGREWLEIVRRDRMHPSILAWVPLNESWGVDGVAASRRQQQWVRALYHATRAADPTRPVVANDGWEYLEGDVWALHSYEPEPADLAARLRRALADPSTQLAPGKVAALGPAPRALPVMLTEFGGVTYIDPARAGAAEVWGYTVAADAADLARRAAGLVAAVRAMPEVQGFVWTQLTDVQQEANGLLYFDRTPKLPLAECRRIFGASGACGDRA